MSTFNWDEYYEGADSRPLHPLYQSLREEHLPESGEGLRAIDLGCGTGRVAIDLLQRGYTVDAVDIYEPALDQLRALAAVEPKLSVFAVPGEEFDFPSGAYDLAVFLFSIFFVDPEQFGGLWDRFVRSLAPGALICGQFLGPNDDWAAEGCTVHNREDLEQMLAGFEPLHWEEADRDGKTVTGKEKHWHIHHVIARLKP
ncbi:MAG: class I SAM-dependent methyltransferase [Fimbriimonadaceae bacterium]